MDDNYKVYIQVDSESRITVIEGGMYPPKDLTDWIQIDEGITDPQYTHPQGNYLGKGLIDENGCYNYKLVNGAKAERTNEEKQAELTVIENASQIKELKQKLAETDYAIIKIAEGVATMEEYADVIAQRQVWREEINELESA